MVLLVSSDPTLRDDWEKGLADGGHDVTVTSTAAGAVSRLRAERIDLLVVDFEVAGGIGPLAEAIPVLRDAPPLILVGAAVEAPAVSARLGAAAFVPKPCGGAELARVVMHQAPTPLPMEEAPTSPIEIARRGPREPA
jgi:DNA-binding response OmpR family regulator